MPASDLTEEILETLGEAAVEIANLSSPENIICRRLRALQRKLVSQSVTIGELAERIGVAPRDVLDAATAVGVRPFWHEGQRFQNAACLQAYLHLQFHYDPVRDVEFSLTPELAGRLAEELSVKPEELLVDADLTQGNRTTSGQNKRSPRKFIASESRLPGQAASNRSREQTS